MITTSIEILMGVSEAEIRESYKDAFERFGWILHKTCYYHTTFNGQICAMIMYRST